jgi:hypothetical protein
MGVSFGGCGTDGLDFGGHRDAEGEPRGPVGLEGQGVVASLGEIARRERVGLDARRRADAEWMQDQDANLQRCPIQRDSRRLPIEACGARGGPASVGVEDHAHRLWILGLVDVLVVAADGYFRDRQAAESVLSIDETCEVEGLHAQTLLRGQRNRAATAARVSAVSRQRASQYSEGRSVAMDDLSGARTPPITSPLDLASGLCDVA